MRLLGMSLMILVMALGSTIVRADQTETEVDYLLTEIGRSGCVFIRNGKEYDPEKAEAHLRMKFERGRRYASTTELFIERLASKSSMSKKPYFIHCDGKARVPSGDWLTSRLDDYRTGQQS